MRGTRHQMSGDLIELSNILSGWMLYLADRAKTPEDGAKLADEILRSGAAYKAWLEIIANQGGDISVFNDPASEHRPAANRILTAKHNGYLATMDCKQVGWAVQRLGAGRAKPGDPVSAHAGLEMHVKLGDRLEAGQPIVTLFAEEESRLNEPEVMLRETLQIAAAPPKLQPLIREVVTAPQKAPLQKV
jgi:pyrimidine-nucleoside phosphorylase